MKTETGLRIDRSTIFIAPARWSAADVHHQDTKNAKKNFRV